MHMRTIALAGLLAALPLTDAFATTWIVTGTGEPGSVTSAACSGTNCPTLRDAINTAVSGDIIRFSSAIDGKTILLSLYSNDLGTSSRTSSQFGPSAFFFTGGKSLTIDGETGLTRGITIARDTAQAPFRLFDIDTGSNSLVLQGLTLRNGLAQGFSSGSGGGALGAGGAIFNQGIVTVDSCTLAGNAAQGGASGDGSGNYGGAGVGSVPPGSAGGGPNGGSGIGSNPGGFGGGGSAYDGGAPGGFGGGGGLGGSGGGAGGFGGGGGAGGSGSSGSGGFGGGAGSANFGGGGAGMGGAIFNDAGALSIVNSTFTANSASGGAGGSGAAGGAGFGGAIFNYSGALTIQSSTLARNSVTPASGGTADGGEVYSVDDRSCTAGGNTCGNSASTFDLANSIFSNSSGSAHDVVITAINGATQPTGGTFSGLIVMAYDNTQFTISNLVSSADPLLSPLGYYGGWTPVLVPHKGSAAIDTLSCAAVTVIIDQRGISRPQGSACDVGAVEYDGDYIFANGFD